METDAKAVFSSFRDPSGFIFTTKSVLYRQINQIYLEDWELLQKSGLAKTLLKGGLLLPYRKRNNSRELSNNAYQIIQPQPVPFISYPYEWCFSELKDAAVLTLKIQKIALEHGMSLKDASAYNIQFFKGRPVLIDHLSFEKYEEKPWVAYRQFCQHFLAPLALASYTDIRLTQLLRVHIDGIPLDLAAKLLPKKGLLNPQILAHIYLHAKSQRVFSDRGSGWRPERKLKLKKNQLLAILNGLESAINKLDWVPSGTEWAEYYDKTNYTRKAFKHKVKIVEKFLKMIKPETVWDLGANTGFFSRLASNRGIPTISFDIDPAAVELNYREVKAKGESKILPLVLDLTNPSGGLGWANRERMTLAERGPADCLTPLALIHHLAISNNLPFAKIAEFFAKLCRGYLIIEFVPKEDSQVQRLLATRKDIFPRYTQNDFEKEFGRRFTVMAKEPVEGLKRVLYLMKVR